MTPFIAPIAFAAAIVALATTAHAQGNAERGAKSFKKCQTCHSMSAAKKSHGPHLENVVGRKAGSVSGYAYSSAMRRSDVMWDEETLDQFIANPKKTVNGTKMSYQGIKDAKEREDIIAFLKANGAPHAVQVAQAAPKGAAKSQPKAAPKGVPAQATASTASIDAGIPVGYNPDVRYTLRTGIAEGRMVYIGVGGAIDGQVNPDLTATVGQIVQVTLINGEGAEHDIVVPDLNVASQHVVGRGAGTTVAFRARAVGTLEYFCSLAGHRESGMLGRLIVSDPSQPAADAEGIDIAHDPAKIPPPIGKRAPKTVVVELESTELEGRLADGTTYRYWTFNNTVPGPFLRVRVGDTVDVRFKNHPDSALIHSVDFHAATGPGGGAAHLQVEPGGTGRVTFKALMPGIYVYHCATPMVAHHIASGMYGLILVEPEEGLPKVDHEFYVMQGEIYTEGKFGEHGSQEFSVEKLLDERAEYVVFNGAVGALTTAHPMKAKVGETVRIFFGVGGPNYTSSFHVIGEIFDSVYNQGDVISKPAKGIQTITVPAGGAAIVDFKLDVPGRYLLVDHALSRLERGLVGFLQAEGPENPEIYKAYTAPATAGGH